MPHWGWRTFILVIYIGVIVVACTTTQNFTPIPPTELPPLTLTLTIKNNLSPPDATFTPLIATPELLAPSTPHHYILAEGETVDDIINHFDVSAEQLQMANAYVDLTLIRSGFPVLLPQAEETPHPQPFHITPPICTITNSDTLHCLGTIENQSDDILQHIAVRLYLLDAEQRILERNNIELEQRYVYPDSRAPYHIQLPLDEHVYQLVLEPARAIALKMPPQEIVVNEKAVDITASQYTVFASIDSLPLDNPQHIRVVLTVYDSDGYPVNYAVRDLNDIDETLEISALLPDTPQNYTHTLHIEGYPMISE